MNTAIVTKYYRNWNYGGCLQGYALCRSIQDLGHECRIVRYDDRNNPNPVYPTTLSMVTQYGPFEVVDKVTEIAMAKLKSRRIDEIIKSRISLFEDFQAMAGMDSSQLYSDENLDSLNEFDAIVSGSDQVWNPNAVREVYLQRYADSTTRKISYAASIGRDRLSKKESAVILSAVSMFDYISVREETARSILCERISKPIKRVVDPTLLIGKKRLAELTQGCKELKIDGQYCLGYFFSPHKDLTIRLQQLCSDRGYTYAVIPYAKQSYAIEDDNEIGTRLYGVGPLEFLGLIQHAECVYTDSFHGAALSILFNRPFVVFYRNKAGRVSMNSRLVDLLGQFNLKSRLATKETVDKVLSQTIDYSFVNQQLELLRNESLEFLNEALGDSK